MTDNLTEKKISQYIETHTSENKFWIDLKMLAKEYDLSEGTIEKILSKSENLIQNRNGQLTTRNLYREKESFLVRLINTLKNKID